jgi:hypothetical protein
VVFLQLLEFQDELPHAGLQSFDCFLFVCGHRNLNHAFSGL